MKKKIILMVFVILLCTGCRNDDDKKQVNILNWSSYIPNSVVLDFERETGVEVNYGTYSSNEECLAKVSVVKEGTYDLIFPSDYMIEIMINRKIIEKIDKSRLDNIGNINAKYLGMKYDPNNEYSIPFVAASTVVAVNRDVISDKIETYNDLLDSKYEGEIVLIDDQRIIIGMALLANGFDMNSTNEMELRVAKNWLMMLKNNLKAYDSDSPKSFLISKEASIAVLWNAEGALANMENENIDIIFPKEGVALSIDNFAIPRGAKNKDEAYMFIDYILRPDVMAKIIENYPYINVNNETQRLFGSDYLENKAANIPDYIFDNGFFVENISDSVKLYDKIWAEIK